MATYSYSFWDTVTFSDTAKTVHEVFQNKQGSSSTQDMFKTNSRGAGQFPDSESFVVEKILFYADSELSYDDTLDSLENSYIEMRYRDQTVLQAQLRECVALSEWSGVNNQASGADEVALGISNDGLKLDMPITIEGGNSFTVKIGQGTALSAGTFTFKVVLVGTYTIGN